MKNDYGPAIVQDSFCMSHSVELPTGDVAELKGVLGNLLDHPEIVPIFKGNLPEDGFTAMKVIRKGAVGIISRILSATKRYLGYVKGITAKGFVVTSKSDPITLFGKMIGLSGDDILKNIPKLREYGSFELKCKFTRRFRVLVVAGEDRWGADGHFRLINSEREVEFAEAVSSSYKMSLDSALSVTPIAGHQIAAFADSQGRPFFGKGVLEICSPKDGKIWLEDAISKMDLADLTVDDVSTIDIIAYPGSVKFATPGIYDVSIYYRNIKRDTNGVKANPQLVRLNVTKASVGRIASHFEDHFKNIADYDYAMNLLNLPADKPTAPELDSGILNASEIIACGIGQWAYQIAPLLKSCVVRGRKMRGFSSYITIGSYVGTQIEMGYRHGEVTWDRVKRIIPLQKGECTIPRSISRKHGLKIGDKISLFASPSTDSACGFHARIVALNSTLGIGISVADAKGAKRDWDGDSIFCALDINILQGVDSVSKSEKDVENDIHDPDWPIVAMVEPEFYKAVDTPSADTALRNILSLLKDLHPACKELVLKYMGAPLQRSVDYKHPRIGGALGLSTAVKKLGEEAELLSKEAGIICKTVHKYLTVIEWLESKGDFDKAAKYSIEKAAKKIWKDWDYVVSLFPFGGLSNPLASLFTMKERSAWEDEDEDDGLVTIGSTESQEKAMRFLGHPRFNNEDNMGWLNTVQRIHPEAVKDSVSKFFMTALEPASRLNVDWETDYSKSNTEVINPFLLEDWRVHLHSYLLNVANVDATSVDRAVAIVEKKLRVAFVALNKRRSSLATLEDNKILRSIRFVAIQNLIRLAGMEIIALFPDRDAEVLDGLKKIILVGFASMAVNGITVSVKLPNGKRINKTVKYNLQSVPYLFPEVARCLRTVFKPKWFLTHRQ